ncbi:MAG: FAD-dependent oxidoreductase, partial [Rhodospirillaceae bacterium]|nr:FAD-dependent oxidoreductase [Rhodospirillaceae bacterium]
WHPEIIPEKKSNSRILVVGSGPAGLECTRSLGNRGYEVVLAEAGTELGGRVARESRLPGLAAWGRVRDYRVGQINTMTNVEVYLDSKLDAAHVKEFGADHVVLATGASWRRNGMGRANCKAIPGNDSANVYTPDDIINGVDVKGPVIIFDDDHFYMGGVIAELIRSRGHEVLLVTPAADVSTWTHHTLEQARIQKRLMQMGIDIVPTQNLAAIHSDHVDLKCVYTDRITKREANSIVLITMRLPNDELYRSLMDNLPVTRIGDALAPATIAHAVYAGHRYARELDEPECDGVPFKRELAMLGEF